MFFLGMFHRFLRLSTRTVSCEYFLFQKRFLIRFARDLCFVIVFLPMIVMFFCHLLRHRQHDLFEDRFIDSLRCSLSRVCLCRDLPSLDIHDTMALQSQEPLLLRGTHFQVQEVPVLPSSRMDIHILLHQPTRGKICCFVSVLSNSLNRT